MHIPRKRFAFVLSIVLAFAAVASAQITSNTNNAATNFEQGWTTARSNPNGVWSYGYSSGFTKPITLYDTPVATASGSSSIQAWVSPVIEVGGSPNVAFNDGQIGRA